jgi:hypothetical protein
MLTPVPSVLFREIEFFDFHARRWLAIDMGEPADAGAGVAETAGTRGGAPTPEASGAG